MKCGWCGSDDIDFEMVDNGVGLQQVTPGICMRCGAVEVGPYDGPTVVHPTERARGWYAGPDELQFVGPFRDSRAPVIRDEALRAWLCDYGTFVLVPWFGMTHASYVEKVFEKVQFRTDCGLVFDACELPYDNFITCLTCLCEETG